MTKRTSAHGLWSSRLAFVLAVSGSAVGLGNIWRFPYITGENGGGAFVLVYLVCVFAIVVPIMMSEVLIGRRGRRNPITTMALVGEEETGHRWWRIAGVMGVLAGSLILSFYSVFAGMSMSYVWQSLTGAFLGGGSDAVMSSYSSLIGSWPRMLLWHTLFMVMTVFVVARGVQRGLEQAVRILMPALVVLLVSLAIYAMVHGEFRRAIDYMFTPNFSQLSWDSVQIAMGHAFFTLSIGMGAVMAYGAYLPEGTSIGSTTVAVVITDTTIAMLAGLVIFPIVFAYGLDPNAGPGLIFQTLPLAFSEMAWGQVFGTLFFVLLAFAAWTSSIGLLEPAVAWLIERRGMHRAPASIVIGAGVWFVGIFTVLSFNALADFTFLHGTLYQNIDHLTTNIMLPLGGLLITLFAGWAMCRNSTSEELAMGVGTRYNLWRFLTRYVAPVSVVVVFVNSSGLKQWLQGLLSGA